MFSNNIFILVKDLQHTDIIFKVTVELKHGFNFIWVNEKNCFFFFNLASLMENQTTTTTTTTTT